MEDTPKHPTLVAALVAVQAEMPEIAKTKTAKVPTKAGGQYSYAYADLADVSAALLPVLAKHGLAFSSSPTIKDGAFVLGYSLLHESDEQIFGSYPLPDPARFGAQEVGSAISYARRYALCSVVGAAPRGDDTDAARTQRSQSAELRRKAEAVRESPEYQAKQAEADSHWQVVLTKAMTLTDEDALKKLFTDEKVSKAPVDIRRQIMDRMRELRDIEPTGQLIPEGEVK